VSDDARKIVEEFDASLNAEWQRQPKTLRPIFGKYLTRNSGFIEYLQDVRDQIETYVNRLSVKRPLNILLAGAPGNGKSFLIKQLIKTIKSDLEIAFEEIYIASLENVTELYSVFQRVQSINLEGKVPAIFFDEIDTPMGEAKLYAKFLAPMWDGTFYIGKERFFLGKSVFFFAGSTLSLEDASKEILDRAKGDKQALSYDSYSDAWKLKFDEYVRHQPDKLSDFVDRIDAIVRIPPIRKELLGEDWTLEYEDVACMLVLKHFPSVKFIGKLALQKLCDELVNGTSLRAAEKLVFNSRLYDSERFDLTCLPRKQQTKHLAKEEFKVGRETSFYEIKLES